MKTHIPRYLAILLLSVSLSALANPCDDGGIGGTGIELSHGIGGTGTQADSGMGGTGITTEVGGIGGTGITNGNQGIGGTGMQADSGMGGTGIVGVITGFGSICVNGLEVHYYDDTPVKLDGEKINSSSLAIGHVVAVKASGSGQSLVAQEIQAYHQITGPITTLDVNGKKIKVMGQTVSANATQLAGMKIGQWVNVSGLRKDDGSVLASRIDLTSEQKTVQTVGNLTRRGNRLYLNGTLVEGISKSLTNSGNDIRITGMWDGKALNVKDMTLGPVSDLLQKIETFHIQGFANDAPNKGRMKVDGQSVVVTEKTKMIGNSTAKNVSGNVVIIRGQMSSGKPNVQSIELKPLKTENRQQLDSRARPLSKKMTDGPSEKSSSNDTNEVKVVKSEKDKRAERTEKTADTEKAKHIKVTDKAERAEKAERPEGVEKVERPESVERVERPEGVEKVERPEGVERVERHEGVERVERHEGVERVERHERH